MSLLLLFNDQANYCELVAGEVTLIGHAPTFNLNILVPVPDPTPVTTSSGGFPSYDAILWPQQWSKPRISVCVLPCGEVKVKGNRPTAVLTDRHFSRMTCGVLQIQAVAFRSQLTDRHFSRMAPAKISTKALPPAIMVQQRAISEDELVCLLML